MDEATQIGQHLTTISSREPVDSGKTCAQSEAAKAKDDAILALLLELGLLYWRPDFTPDQSKVVIRQYVEDLREFAVKDIQHAVKVYRRNPDNKFFPHPGALRGLIETPPAWFAKSRGDWLRDCHATADHELQVKIRAIEHKQRGPAIAHQPSTQADRKGITIA